MKEHKVIIVATVKHVDAWSPEETKLNLPDWIDASLGRSAVDLGEVVETYWLDDPTVYIDLDDFDEDRAMKRDHFAPQTDAGYVAGASELLACGLNDGDFDFDGTVERVENGAWVSARIFISNHD